MVLGHPDPLVAPMLRMGCKVPSIVERDSGVRVLRDAHQFQEREGCHFGSFVVAESAMESIVSCSATASLAPSVCPNEYSAPLRVEVISRRAGTDDATVWSSDGKGSYTIAAAEPPDAPGRGTHVILHLMEDASSFVERYTLKREVKAQSGHVPVPIAIVEKPGAEPQEVADGAALWVKPRAEITPLRTRVPQVVADFGRRWPSFLSLSPAVHRPSTTRRPKLVSAR
jgi:hypothetical protein